jgi:hypothetical protein
MIRITLLFGIIDTKCFKNATSQLGSSLCRSQQGPVLEAFYKG